MNKFENPKLTGENREKQRAYYIPFPDMESAKKNIKEANPNYTLLNGEWDFKYFDTYQDLPENLSTADFPDKISVPLSWQCAGYGQFLYVDMDYPFPYNPPFVSSVNPVGVYKREITLESFNKMYIVFEGVCSYFELYVNGHYIGMSKGSHLQSEFFISPYLKCGKNELIVSVYSYNDGSYHEAQDFFRLHGIFRDVYLLNRPENHIRDIYIKTDISGNVDLEADFIGNDTDVSFTVVSPDGKEYTSDNLHLKIDNPILWNAEKPVLYDIYIKAGAECIKRRIGFRSVGVSENSELLINGVAVKLKGVYIAFETSYQSIWYGSPDIEWYSIIFDFTSKYSFYDYRFQILRNYPFDLFEKIYESHQSSPMLALSCFYELLDDIYKKMELTSDTRPHSSIEPAINYIEQNYDKTFPVETLATFCHISKSALFKQFKNILGVTPIEYKHNFMIQNAIELLSNTDMSIDEISAKVGFSSSNYFRKIFTRLTDKTPKELRKK